MRRALGFLTFLTSLVAVQPGYANQQLATVSFFDFIPAQTTNWNEMANLQKFDTNLGTLVAIKLTLLGSVAGEARFESLDAAPTTVTTNLSATLTLFRPDMTTLVVALPAASTMDMVTAFDGMSDFGGTSGRTYTDLQAVDSNMATLGPPVSMSDEALFAAPGGGMLNLPVTAIGTSNASGAGNLLVQFNTMAGARATIEYTYKVPEPATLALLLIGGPVLFRRRRAI